MYFEAEVNPVKDVIAMMSSKAVELVPILSDATPITPDAAATLTRIADGKKDCPLFDVVPSSVEPVAAASIPVTECVAVVIPRVLAID